MVLTKSEDVAKQGYSEENSVFGRVSYYLLLEVLWEGVWWGGRLFEVGANSRLGAYSNKYSIYKVVAYGRCLLRRSGCYEEVDCTDHYSINMVPYCRPVLII